VTSRCKHPTPDSRVAQHRGDNKDMDEQEDLTTYKVVVNHEEQYSIWPVDRENPLGWSDAGKSGTKAECLAFVKEVWTDMRPLSVRRLMEDGEPAS
jgi:MbtH protein